MVTRHQGGWNRHDMPQVSLWTNVVMLTIAIGFAAGYRLGTSGESRSKMTVQPLSTRVYEVQDILAHSPDGQKDLSDIVTYIHSVIEPTSWQAPDRLLLAYARQQSIVVKQTPDVHLQISSFLDDLRARYNQQPSRLQHVREVLNPIRYELGKSILC